MAVTYRSVARRKVKPVVVVAPDYGSMTKDELVAAAKARGLDSTGTKAEITARLTSG